MVDQITKFAELADIVLPSFEDEAAYFYDTTPAETVKRYVNCDANIVVFKNSTNEIVAVHGESRTQMQPKKIARSKIFMQIPSDRIGFLKGGIFFVLEQWNNEGCQTAVRDVIVANNASVE